MTKEGDCLQKKLPRNSTALISLWERGVRNLAERELVVRDENEQGRRVFHLTDTAEALYFDKVGKDSMDFGD